MDGLARPAIKWPHGSPPGQNSTRRRALRHRPRGGLGGLDVRGPAGLGRQPFLRVRRRRWLDASRRFPDVDVCAGRRAARDPPILAPLVEVGADSLRAAARSVVCPAGARCARHRPVGGGVVLGRARGAHGLRRVARGPRQSRNAAVVLAFGGDGGHRGFRSFLGRMGPCRLHRPPLSLDAVARAWRQAGVRGGAAQSTRGVRAMLQLRGRGRGVAEWPIPTWGRRIYIKKQALDSTLSTTAIAAKQKRIRRRGCPVKPAWIGLCRLRFAQDDMNDGE